MARLPETVASAVDILIRDMESEGYYSKRTLRFYREQCTHVFQILNEVYPEAIPKNVTKEMVIATYELMRDRGYAVSTQRDYLHGLRKLCDASNNHVFDNVRIPFQVDTRPNVDWLSFEQAQKLLRCDKTVQQDLIISLELCHGLRRCEILRLKIADCHANYLTVTGKGRGGGKLRSVPMHPSFPQILSEWMQVRDELIAKARKINPMVEAPDALLIWEQKGKLRAYSDTRGSGIDRIVQTLADQVGFDFSNHTLRRTFGREMYRSGVNLVTIAKLMGHESTDQTLRYLGIDLDDMALAMASFRLR